MLDRGEAAVIDVREDSEWEAGHAPGARHIVLEEVAARVEEIEKDRPVVFQCRGGSRTLASSSRASTETATLEPEGGHIEGA